MASNWRFQMAAKKPEFLCTAREWFWWIDMVKFAVITRRLRRMRLRNCSPIQAICSGSSPNKLAFRFGIQNGCSFVANHPQILAIFVLWQSIDDSRKFRLSDETHAEGDLLETCDFQSLSMFDSRDVIAGLKQTGLRAGIEPGQAAAEQFHVQLFAVKVKQIQIGDLQFAAR